MRTTARQTRENRTITVDFQTKRPTCSAWRRQGVCRMRARLSPGSGLSAQTQGHLSRWRGPDAALPLCPCAPGWRHHLAHPVHHVSCGVHRPAPLHLALSPDASRGGPHRPLGDAWGTEFGAVCGDWAYRADGALSPGLCLRPPQSGDGLDPVWVSLPVYLLADESIAVVWQTKCTCPPLSAAASSGTWATARRPVRSFYAVLPGVPTCSSPAGASLSGPGHPARWLRQYHEEHADTVSRSAPRHLPASRAQQAPEETGGDPVSLRSLPFAVSPLFYRASARSLRVFALGQRLRRFVDHVTPGGRSQWSAGAAMVPGEKGGLVCRARRPAMPVTSPFGSAHNAIDRKLFMMKGFHHPQGSQQAFLRGLAHLYNLVPYQRRAQHAGPVGVESKEGAYPPQTGFSTPHPHFRWLSMSDDTPSHVIRWNVENST